VNIYLYYNNILSNKFIRFDSEDLQMNHNHFGINKLYNRCARVYTVFFFCLLLICPLHANVRLFVRENLDFLKDITKNRFCQPPPAPFKEDGPCRYQWLLDMKKSSVNAMSDSLIDDLWGIIGNFKEFPSNIGAHYMNDPLCVAFFVAVFCDQTLPTGRRYTALSILLNETSSGVLIPHKKKLISCMRNNNRINFEEKAIAAALLKLTENERNSLFKGQEALKALPLRARVLYGDKEAIAKMAAQFDDTTKSNWDRMRAMRDLIASGVPEAIRHVIEQFGRIYHPDACISITPQYEITIALAYHHPGDPIFNEKLKKARNPSVTLPKPTTKKEQLQYYMKILNTEVKPEAVAEYYKKLYAWMYDNYKVKPLDPPPYTFFGQRCFKF